MEKAPKLIWEECVDPAGYHQGYAEGLPGVMLFLIRPMVGRPERGTLTGAFVPDAEERENFYLKDALVVHLKGVQAPLLWEAVWEQLVGLVEGAELAPPGWPLAHIYSKLNMSAPGVEWSNDYNDGWHAAASFVLSIEPPKGGTPTLLTGVDHIANERARQQYEEGWTADGDAAYKHGELAAAAGCYALDLHRRLQPTMNEFTTEKPVIWPWLKKWWKPTHCPIRQLAKAGALIAAEIDRIQAIPVGSTDDCPLPTDS